MKEEESRKGIPKGWDCLLLKGSEGSRGWRRRGDEEEEKRAVCLRGGQLQEGARERRWMDDKHEEEEHGRGWDGGGRWATDNWGRHNGALRQSMNQCL